MHKLLVIEDEIKTANSLSTGLTENGYAVDVSYDGENAWALIQKNRYDLIVTDIIIPNIDGFEICSKTREANIDTPILILSALSLVSDKIKGFDAGTDDYMVKPFDFQELCARVNALLKRRTGKQAAPQTITYADMMVNTDTKEVYRNGVHISLTAKEYALLIYFMNNRHILLTKELIAENVWDVDFRTGTNFVEVYVSYLRNKIDKHAAVKLIHTRKGLGYIFKAETHAD